MIMGLAVIRITNLRLRTYIGIKEEEISNKQDIVINVVIHYPAEKAMATDNVEHVLNYRTICKRMINHVEQGRFFLLEKLTKDLLDIAADHPWVKHASVTVDKPHALRFADSVSLTLSLDND